MLLILFAFVAGIGTALSPCVLPVLPALLSAGATGGRRRPIGIVLGLTVTFAVTIIGLATLVDGVGLGDGATRTIAIVTLAVFGVAVAFPVVGDRLEAPLSRLARLGPRSGGEGFWSGVLVGGALGFLYAPCAGPILAAVIVVGADSGRAVAVGIAYSAGSAVVLLLLALGGRAVADRVRAAGRGPQLRQALGGVMIATAVAMSADLDVRFQTAIADRLPSALVNPTQAIEDSAGVKRELEELRGRSRFVQEPRATDSGLPVLGTAPEFTGTQEWFNTAGGRPLTLAGLRGRVVLIDYWTYTCINCIRTLPYVTAWDRRYRAAGLTVVGVHTPEFAFEKDAGNVRAAIAQNDIRHPVVQDNDMATWNAWGNQYWPAKYLVDAGGKVRYAHFGEGDYDKTEDAIRGLLRERGSAPPRASAAPAARPAPARRTTPETYLGTDRAQGFTPAGAPRPGRHTYPPPPRSLPADTFALSGTWTADGERATARRDAAVDAQVRGRDVYLVLAPPRGGSGRVSVLVDGAPIASRDAGDDVRGGRVTVDRQRLFHLVHLERSERHRLTLRLGDGISGYAFTFG
ncbi:MAG TPA: cytochrome c biogenesis protein DipZ [Solirubrobacteraceae bacterium]|nr:cytochrome c biogenesis protein DipZ [Solirubrobacteraceae bacterium]